MEGARVIKGVIRDGSGFCWRRLSNEGVDEIGDLGEEGQLRFKKSALLGREVFFEPKVDVVNHCDGVLREGSRRLVTWIFASGFARSVPSGDQPRNPAPDPSRLSGGGSRHFGYCRTPK